MIQLTRYRSVLNQSARDLRIGRGWVSSRIRATFWNNAGLKVLEHPRLTDNHGSRPKHRPIEGCTMRQDTVLVVDDDPQVRELYVQFLEEDYTVLMADDGETALEQMDSEIDVVLLDRRMPGLSGDEFLKAIRDQGYDCPVALVSAVSPDLDILDLGFEDYLVKPVTKEDLLTLTDSLVRRIKYERHVQDWLALLSKKATLERSLTSEELDESTAYSSMLAQIDQLNERADSELEELQHDEVDAIFQRLDSPVFEED